MTNAVEERFPMTKTNLVSWQLILLKLLLLVSVAVMLEVPAGSIAGRLALQQEGFNLYSYDLRQHKVYAIAIGPRNGNSQERGVWVNQDGTFRIDQLPVGEYELKVHVPGFSTSYDNGIFVEKNGVTNLKHDVTLQLSSPSVNMASNARVFTTKEQPRFWINAQGSSEAEVSVYKRDMMPLVKGLYNGGKPIAAPNLYGFDMTPELSVYKPYDSTSRKKADAFFSAMTPLRTWTRQLSTDESDYSREEFKFEAPLAPGDYFAVARVKNIQNKRDWNLLWFTVTDIGLIVKQDPWQTVTRAIDLNTLKPISGFNLQLFERDNPLKPIGTAKTDAEGFAKMVTSGPLNVSRSLMVYGTIGEQHAYGAYGFYSSNNDSTNTYFYTDRPVYRLGQTVYYKGIARTKSLNGFKNPGANLKVTASVEDPDNNVIHQEKFKTNAHGSFHGLIEIPKEGKTGAYQITLQYPDGSQDYERFEVAEYRKPEYKVDVTPLEPRIVSGSKGKARIKASYYFGAPVSNAKVKYTIFSAIDWAARYNLMDRPAYYDYFDGWDHDDDGSSDGGYSGDYVSEGYATTDENGEAVVEFQTKSTTFDKDRPWEYDRYDHKYKVEAEVTDISRLSVLGSGSVTVTNGAFGVFVQPDSYIAKVGEPIGADVTAVSYDDHQPMANQPVKMQLYRRIYDRQRSEYKGVQVYEEKTVNTDAKGHAHVQFQTKPEFVTDDYEVLAVSHDKNNNTIVDESSVWVVSKDSPFRLGSADAAKEPLAVKLDKQVYKAGDVAKVMITAPVTGSEGAQAIVSVEGAKLYNYRVVNMTATGQMVEIPLTVDYAPNVFVNVTFVGKKHQFYTTSTMIRVSPEDRFLQVNVETDKSKYKPGENATYTVTAKYADGKPAANTELSLAVVDESIFAIRPDITQDIRKFFYARTSNVVTTICSFPEENSGGPNKIEPRVRKDFRDTAAWVPDLITDKEGVARTTVKLPDNLTTWRATVRGITLNTDVGSTIQKVISTQDLILRLALPRFFSQGDEGFITAVVHNYTDRPQLVRLTLDASDQFKVKESLVQKLTVNPDKALRYSWPVTLQSSGEAVVECKAVGDTAGDAMQSKVPVLPLGIQEFISKSGIITADDETVTLQGDIPKDAVPGSVKHHVYMSSSALGPLLGNFHSLIDYPYGCTEQTMSRLMPAVVAVRMNQTLGLPLTAGDKKKFKDVYKMSMDKLDGYQHEDGGWGWWSNDESSMNLTALVLDGYTLLKEAGYTVDPERAKNGKNWLAKSSVVLHKQLTDPLHKPDFWSDTEHGIDLARAYFVLNKYGVKTPSKVREWVLSRKDKLTPEMLAFYSVTFDKQGEHEVARTLYDRLVELGNITTSDAGNMLDWAPSKQMMTKLNPGAEYQGYYSYRYTDVETTALAFEAALQMEPENSDRMEAIKRWILMQRGKDGWSNTKTTAEVFRAFMDSEIAQKHQGSNTEFVSDVLIGGQLSKELNFGSKSILEPEKDVLLQLKPQQGKVAIHKKGPGKLYYTSLVTYYRAIKPGEHIAQQSTPDGLQLRREFFKLVAGPSDSSGNVQFKAVALPNRTVRAGETVLMKVFVDSPTAVPYTYLKAPLPSGAEVVENDSRENAQEEGSDKKADAYSWGNWWWTHQDVMDDHLAFFVTEFGRGKFEFHQMVRMEIPGKFQMNPVLLEGMYTNKVRAHSQADVITVTE